MNRALDNLQQLATRGREDAALNIARVQEESRSADRKLSAIETFIADYEQRILLNEKTDMTRLANLQRFLAQLHAAAADQRSICLNAQARLAQAQEAWQRARRHEHSLELLLERRRATERQRESRQQQKLQDEFSSRLGARASFAA